MLNSSAEDQRKRLSGHDFRALASDQVINGTQPDIVAFLAKTQGDSDVRASVGRGQGDAREVERERRHLGFESDEAESESESESAVTVPRSPAIEPVIVESHAMQSSEPEADEGSGHELMLPDYVSRFETQEPLELVEQRIGPTFHVQPVQPQSPVLK